MRKKLYIVLLFSVLPLFLLSGCWNNKQINRLAFVMGVAVDQGQDSSEYEVTAQIAKPSALSLQSGGGGEDDAYANLTQNGIGIEKAISKISNQTNRQLYASHNQVIVIGMNVAKDDISPIIDYFVRSTDVRFVETLYIAEGDAKEFLDVAGDLEKLPVTYLKQLGESRLEPGEISANSLIYFLNSSLSKTSSPMVSILKLTEDENGEKRVELSGMAIFKDTAVCAVLDEKETESVMLIHEKANGSFWQIDIFGGHMTLKVMDSKVDIVPIFSGDNLEKIRVDLDLGCSITDMAGKADVLSLEARDQIEDALRKELSNSLRETLEHTQENSADVFGFGELLYRYHTRKCEGLVENWESEYPKLKVEFNISVEILSTGSIIQPIELGAEQ